MAKDIFIEPLNTTFELKGIQHKVTIQSGIDEKGENYYRAILSDGRIIHLALNFDTDLWEDKEHGPTPESEAIGHVLSNNYE